MGLWPGGPHHTGERGKLVFEAHCGPCHGSEGRGGPGKAPSLEGSPWLGGQEDRAIRIVLHGRRGPVEMGGRAFRLRMPGFGRVLDDEEIANVLSLLRELLAAD